MSPQRLLTLTCLVALGLAVSACGKKSDDKVLATVNGEDITQTAFDRYLQVRRGEPMADKEKERAVVLGELQDRLLLTQHALETGLENDPDVGFTLARARENILIQALIRKTVSDTPVTDDALKAQFQREVEKTSKTEFRMRHILVKTEAEARDVAKQLAGGANFKTLARKKSLDDQTAANGGDLGWTNEGSMPPEIFAAAMATGKGAVSAPVKTDFGWHVIKVDETRALKIPTYDEFIANPRARAGLAQKIQNERLTTLLDDLKKKAKITTP